MENLHFKIMSGAVEGMFGWVVEPDVVKVPLDDGYSTSTIEWF